MRALRRTTAALVIVAGALFVPSSASAIDHVVQAGAVAPEGQNFEYTRFYPDVLKVHTGQVVRWNIAGFHTVTFSTLPPSTFMRADDIPGTYAVSEDRMFASDCGIEGAPTPCVLDETTTFISSGTPFMNSGWFDVQVNLGPGSYGYYCAIHSGMNGTIEVVDGSELVSDPDDVQAQRELDIAADTAAAIDVFEAGQIPASSIEDGQRVWEVKLGDRTPDNDVQILSYLPSDLSDVSPGDKVRFSYPGGIESEIHTVSFPNDPSALRAAGSFYFSCDPDDRATGAKGLPTIRPFCPLLNQEVGVAPWMTTQARAPLDMVSTEATVHDSGLLVSLDAPSELRLFPDTGEPMPSTFEAVFPTPGTFSYVCNVHGALMSGSVRVG